MKRQESGSKGKRKRSRNSDIFRGKWFCCLNLTPDSHLLISSSHHLIMSSRRLNSSYSQIPLNVTRRLTEEGKKIIRETCLYFVRGAGGQRLGKVSQSAQELVRQSGMAESLIRSVSEDDVLKSLKSRKNREEVCGVFVLEHLSGTLYEELRLRSKETPSCRVIRPIAILHSQRLNNEVTIPVKPHPLLSMAMDTVPGITLAGDLSPEERHSLARKIMLMCGRPLSVIRPNVTAVVVSRNMTDLRCIEARKMGIVILTPEWVEYCYTESDKNNYVFGRDCYKEFMLPAFAGMTFSPAQVCHRLCQFGTCFNLSYRSAQKTGKICELGP